MVISFVGVCVCAFCVISAFQNETIKLITSVAKTKSVTIKKKLYSNESQR